MILAANIDFFLMRSIMIIEFLSIWKRGNYIFMIHSDWHIHSEYSYDSTLTIEAIVEAARGLGVGRVGITDHANLNDEKFKGDARRSAAAVREAQKKYPFIVAGVELSPYEKPKYDYIEKHGTLDGYVQPVCSEIYELEMALTKEEMLSYGIRYAVGAAHVRTDCAKEIRDTSVEAEIRDWYRQQMWLACDERVTILGHPWYSYKELWYDDFSVIPHSMNLDIGAALKENGKYVECNVDFFTRDNTSEKFRNQYAEFLRELFEMGIPVTYGSDSHKRYNLTLPMAEKYLRAAGFGEGDFSEISECDLW